MSDACLQACPLTPVFSLEPMNEAEVPSVAQLVYGGQHHPEAINKTPPEPP
ncbi:Uncharacterised protein [Chlamydia trachomatis]|nr:Uncharacterised protein [Chlamydia trachomatis]